MDKIIMFLGLSIFGMMVTNYAGIALIAAIALFAFLAIAHEWMQERKRRNVREYLIRQVYQSYEDPNDTYYRQVQIQATAYLTRVKDSPEGFLCQDCGSYPGHSCVDVTGREMQNYHYSRLNQFHNSREDSCEEGR